MRAVARTWLQIRVDLLGGRGVACDPSPGRVFLVRPSHSFEQFAEAIDAAFARWDLSHLHTFELSDGWQRRWVAVFTSSLFANRTSLGRLVLALCATRAARLT